MPLTCTGQILVRKFFIKAKEAVNKKCGLG
jgi:hypothetical protein